MLQARKIQPWTTKNYLMLRTFFRFIADILIRNYNILWSKHDFYLNIFFEFHLINKYSPTIYWNIFCFFVYEKRHRLLTSTSMIPSTLYICWIQNFEDFVVESVQEIKCSSKSKFWYYISFEKIFGHKLKHSWLICFKICELLCKYCTCNRYLKNM